MATVSFIKAAHAYAKLCVFDQEENVVKSAKMEFKEAFSSQSAFCSDDDRVSLVFKLKKKAPNAANKVEDWTWKKSFLQMDASISEEEMFDAALKYEMARSNLRNDKVYLEYLKAKRVFTTSMVELGRSGYSMDKMNMLLEVNNLLELTPRLEKLYKHVVRDSGHGQAD